jgi:uncharacterized ion transporter superfamily protein YfcC
MGNILLLLVQVVCIFWNGCLRGKSLIAVNLAAKGGGSDCRWALEAIRGVFCLVSLIIVFISGFNRHSMISMRPIKFPCDKVAHFSNQCLVVSLACIHYKF